MSTKTNIRQYQNGTVSTVLTFPIGTEAVRYYYHGDGLMTSRTVFIGDATQRERARVISRVSQGSALSQSTLHVRGIALKRVHHNLQSACPILLEEMTVIPVTGCGSNVRYLQAEFDVLWVALKRWDARRAYVWLFNKGEGVAR